LYFAKQGSLVKSEIAKMENTDDEFLSSVFLFIFVFVFFSVIFYFFY